ncbi:hypothetical protein [Bradyrhizobium zhanjiangense]|uniref:Uncharacterized protein n=1 Tax=Bradyrhizobium zhanjiangense TaxID=1325107 RepID=A0A4Q0Q9W3_9BRAD|nr:hypothetical protein [Bradyrhizobium zhanjiangense]RXG85346.1 hypothetical protein EAS61_36460 [Bradyrhizobium zhanjiangense]
MSQQYIGTARYQNGQTKAVSGTSATFNNVIGSGVTKAMLGSTVDICFVQGKAPLTATTSDTPVFASNAIHITIRSGESVAIIARDGTSTGTAYLSEAV